MLLIGTPVIDPDTFPMWALCLPVEELLPYVALQRPDSSAKPLGVRCPSVWTDGHMLV